jgi:hypothetical protein
MLATTDEADIKAHSPRTRNTPSRKTQEKLSLYKSAKLQVFPAGSPEAPAFSMAFRHGG